MVILNDAAWSILQAQRRPHPIWVFSYKERPIGTMNITAWQCARQKGGLRAVRIHDLRHTYGSRLRAADVSYEDRAALLGHACRSMPERYASPDIKRLLWLANRVVGLEVPVEIYLKKMIAYRACTPTSQAPFRARSGPWAIQPCAEMRWESCLIIGQA